MDSLQQQKDHPLVPLAHQDAPTAFPDSKTRQLYSVFPSKDDADYCEADMREAQANTSLNSHFSASKCKSFHKNIDLNLAIRGVTLRENSNSTDFNRNRTYSIVKTTRERRDTITASELQRLPKDSGMPKQIVYSYAERSDQHYPAVSEVVQSRYVPQQKDSSLKSSRNDLRSLLSTRHNPNCSEYQPKTFQLPRQKAKSYKFVKMHLKTNEQQQERMNCNLFSFLDGVFNTQDTTLKKCPSAKLEPVAKPIRLKPWK